MTSAVRTLKHHRYRTLLTVVSMCLCLVSPASAQTPPLHWYQKSGGDIGAVMGLMCTPQGTLYASVYQGGILRSDDTGRTWVPTAPSTDGVWSMVHRPNGEIIASLWSYGVIRSTDRGATWTRFGGALHHADVRGVNSAGIVFAESAGQLYRSAAGDTVWTPVPVPAGVMAVNGSTIVAAKGIGLYRSSDGGASWTPMKTAPATIYAAAVDGNGNVLAGTYHDGFSSAPSIFAISAANPDWKGSGPQSTINAIVRGPAGHLFAASHDSGFYASPDSGATWRTMNEGLRSTKVLSIAMVSETTIVLGTPDGVFFSSRTTGGISTASDHPPAAVPAFAVLQQNYPNPFNPSTLIRYSLRTAGPVTLTVTDLLGRTAAVPVDAWNEAGEHTVRFDASALAAGPYLYTLRTGTVSVTHAMLLLR